MILMQFVTMSHHVHISQKVGWSEIDVGYRYMVVQIGLDWYLAVWKAITKKGLKHLFYAVEKDGWLSVWWVSLSVLVCGYQS